MASPGPRNIHEDTIDTLLDRISDMREELLSIERSLERIQTVKLEQGKDKSGKQWSLVLVQFGFINPM
jgi:hypothetical protein